MFKSYILRAASAKDGSNEIIQEGLNYHAQELLKTTQSLITEYSQVDLPLIISALRSIANGLASIDPDSEKLSQEISKSTKTVMAAIPVKREGNK